MSISLVLGSQNNLLNVGINGTAVLQNSIVAAEWSGGIAMDLCLSKYGVSYRNKAINFESYLIIGASKDRENTPFYSGDLLIQSIDSLQNVFQTFSGIGLGVKKMILNGDLKHLGNQQGIFIARVRSSNNLILIKIKNDFKSGFIFGGGTDQSETGSFYIGYSTLDKNKLLHSIGLNLSLFTPKPDYSRNPTNPINSDTGSRPVLYGTEPYADLFHGNLYLNYNLSSNNFNQFIGIGIDSQKLGGTLQNLLHDSFGLYPRFGWDKNAKTKLYFQSKTSLGYGL